MGESVREQLIRLGIIKPGPDPQVSPPRALPVATPKDKRATPERAKPAPRPPKATQSKEPVRHLDLLKNFAGAMPGSETWYESIGVLEKHLIKMPINDFRVVVGHRVFGDVLNICEYIDRIHPAGRGPSGWLIEIARDFCDLSKNLRAETYELSQAYQVAVNRHRLALAVWDVARTQDRSETTRERIFDGHAWGGLSRRWVDAAWNDPSEKEQRKAEIRVAFARYASQCLRQELGIKPAKVEPANSVWEAHGASRRFGGGRPRNERFRR